MSDARKVADRLTAAVIAEDLEAVTSCYSSDAVVIAPEGTFKGQDQIAEFFTAWFDPFSELTVEVGTKAAWGNQALDEWCLSAKNTGALALAQLQRANAADQQARRAADRLRALGALYAAQRAEQASRAGFLATVDPASPLAGLSAREAEVLGLLTEGLSDREIAERLCISAHTVHRHVSNILTKLGLSSRAAAAAVAGRHGLGARAPGR